MSLIERQRAASWAAESELIEMRVELIDPAASVG
jgi:hypothetical protein